VPIRKENNYKLQPRFKIYIPYITYLQVLIHLITCTQLILLLLSYGSFLTSISTRVTAVSFAMQITKMLPSLHRSTPILLLTLLHYCYYTTNIIPPLLSISFLSFSTYLPNIISLFRASAMLIIIFHIRATVMWRETELFVHEYALGDRLLSRDLNALTRQTTNHRQ
jgi:hypothetical protein